MCHNPSDDSDIPKYLPAGLSKYVLHSFTDKSSPFHPTTEDVVKSGIPVDIEKITGHQLVRRRGGKLAVMYETHWEGLSSITWEREIDLKNFSRHILEYWMSTPRQMKGVNSKYSAKRRAQTHRAYWRHQNKYYLEQGYHLVSYSTWEKKFRGRRVPLQAFFWWKNHQGWWVGQVKAWDRDVYDQYFVRFHDDPEPSQVMLAEEFYTTDVDGVPGSWCLQSHVREGIFRDADMSRDDDFQESGRAKTKTNISRPRRRGTTVHLSEHFLEAQSR